jgi:hypothetical protein
MAVKRGWTLGGAVLLALATGIPIGCGSDACALSCDVPHATVRTDKGDPFRVTMCIDDDCRDLGDRYVTETDPGYAEVRGFDDALPDGPARIRVTVRDAAGEVVSTFDDVREPARGCCGPFIALTLKDDDLVWVDG